MRRPRNVDNRPRALGNHAAKGGVRQVHGGHDVDLVHLVLARDVGLEEEALGTEAGVVHEDLETGGGVDVMHDSLDAGGGCEVGHQGVGADAIGACEVGRDLLEAVQAAGDEREVVARLREFTGESNTQSCGCSRNDGEAHSAFRARKASISSISCGRQPEARVRR